MYSAVHTVIGECCLRTHQLYCCRTVRMTTYILQGCL